MTTSDLLAKTWQALENENFDLPGNYERRILSHSAYSIFAGINRPSKLIQLSLTVTIAEAAKVHDQEVKGFRLIRDHVPSEATVRLRIELTDLSYEDIFLLIASDILDKLLEINDENQTATILERRIEHWKKFMQASGPGGLTRSQQIGLFGELLILKSLQTVAGMQEHSKNSWCGPSGTNQDFINGDRAIEVKTSASNEMSRIRITNEFQLDSVGLNRLFLCHICVDEKKNAGISLPVLIDEIRNGLTGHLLAIFLDSLAEVGYHDSQKNLYEHVGYTERSRIYYRVSDSFPRILPSSLMDGVNEVSYQVDLSAAKTLKVSEVDVFSSFFACNP